jgi:hypothetical protein
MMRRNHPRCRSCVGCRLDHAGFLRVTFPAGARISLDHSRKITAACSSLTKGIPRPAIVDFRNARSIDWRARRYFFHDRNHLETYSAVAILVRTDIGRIVGELFSWLLRPRKPARLFTCDCAAGAWLLQFARVQEGGRK